jgi:hypothetical protein
MVPQNKRKAAYQMFYNFINNRGINIPVWFVDQKIKYYLYLNYLKHLSNVIYW